MKKYCTLFLLIFLIISCNKGVEKNKILFITTSVNKMGGKPNGTYLIELAIPFNEFSKKQYQIDIMSPNGGEIPMYHSGDTTEIVKSIIKSDVFYHKTKNSLKPKDINPEEYLAVFIPGGYGQFWDTHKSGDVQKIIAKIYESNGVIGTVGHGTATLIDVKLKSGAYLVSNKTMTSFPSWNEKNIMKQSNFGALLPYDMEVELQKRGADLKIYNHEKKVNYEVVDSENRLITASFSTSGKFVAEEVLKLLNTSE
ncbi:type 1 glutamine amidotransferase domain-containing protein [Aquimarina spinulae]|uniref:type 1 glutamine amidotransferase domain-containing protein n=1 Tax=Aquimarina spinulae TaxID=1192023 RepID=UPI000D551019|nr:type 1 glutamine amidotransferase domain-containing protein [Aquimarina spinulae]